MITGKKFVIIANVDTVQDAGTGDRTTQVTSGKKIAAKVELVGIQTAQVGQSQGFNLVKSVEVLRVHYNEEKYLYFDSNLYVIRTMSKAKLETNMLLNVEKLDDAKIKKAIEDWLK